MSLGCIHTYENQSRSSPGVSPCCSTTPAPPFFLQPQVNLSSGGKQIPGHISCPAFSCPLVSIKTHDSSPSSSACSCTAPKNYRVKTIHCTWPAAAAVQFQIFLPDTSYRKLAIIQQCLFTHLEMHLLPD